MTMTSPARLRAHHSEFVKHSISSRLPDILLSVVNEMPQIDQEGEHASKIKVAAKGLADGTFTITSINSSDGGPCWIGKVGGHNLETDAHSLLVDDSKQVYQKLLQLQTPQFEGGSSSVVTIILDNCGTELLYDLIFVEYLLRTFPKISICLHCKSHPVFVSDALKVDVMTHIDELKTIGKAGSLSEYCDSGRLSLSEHDFYT
mmetsp:Transcript_34587/g.42635  ORF Transcript_34587/g.42635 Transcript_34587/m.42635 type:complete len:203 (+) Transcript_34587:146-754(+)